MKFSTPIQTKRFFGFTAIRLETFLQKPRAFALRYWYSVAIISSFALLVLSAVHIHASPLLFAFGILNFFVTLFAGTIDQERKGATEASRAREETLAHVSHDLKNPLTNLFLNCNIILPLLSEGDPKLIARRIQSMQRSISQMERLINDLLDASMLDSRTFSVSRSETELSPLLQNICDSHRMCAERKGVMLEFRDEKRKYCLNTDGKRLEQALTNILSNAVKFSPRGGKILVKEEWSENQVQISISDEGPGIPLENHDQIFFRNWQAKETAYLGSGLGLYISKGIVDTLGGKITLRSEIGHGSTFCITFRLPSSAGLRMLRGLKTPDEKTANSVKAE